ncbi:transposase [Serratia marcescens]|nr:transposase [Serratia marcescens]MBI6124991.1 transposase [Serratia marcescens]MBI6131491.1 transposase [Serratia marcescens]MBN5304114.1 transposase [Serratia marcescens]MBN5322618.1 transposase [Serratia marcescens]
MFRANLATTRTAQGPECIFRVLYQLVFEYGVKLRIIQSGKPTQNGFIDSLNGDFSDGFLN